MKEILTSEKEEISKPCIKRDSYVKHDRRSDKSVETHLWKRQNLVIL